MGNPLRVLHVVPHMQIGGINRFVLDLVSCQTSDLDVQVGIYVCCSRNPQWQSQCEKLNVTVYWDNIKGMDMNPFHYKKFIGIKERYDVIHWHVFSPILALISWCDSKCHVFTHHSVLGTGRIRKKTDYLKWKIFKNFVNHKLTCEVYNSEYTRDFWQSYGLKAKYNALVYNGAVFNDSSDSDISLPQNILNTIQSRFVVGTSSNFIGYKRINLLIDSFAKFSMGKTDVRLLIVGDGPESESLHNQVKSLEIEDKVVFTGHRTDVVNYQKLMHVCVFPSITETFGLAALECMHLGKPTICMSDGGGICEVVGNDKDIAKDIEDLQNILETYYNFTPEQYHEAGEKAKKRSCLFLMSDKAKEYNELYKRLCWHQL